MSASTLRKLILTIGTVAAMAGPAMGTAQADDDHWRNERHGEGHWRHEGWEHRHRPSVLYQSYGPPVVYYQPYGPPVVYAPPPVVYAPPAPGISIVVPLNIR